MKKDVIVPTGAGPIDLSQVARVAKETGSVSPPQVARTMHLDLQKAETALADLAKGGYLELSPESGIVRTYNVTRNAYEMIEAGRRRSIFGGIFGNEVASKTRG